MGKSSLYRGVTLFRPTGKWRAQISANGKTTSLGDHDTEEEAARAFDRAAINKDGSRARTNFPVDQYETEVDDLQKMSQTELVAMLRSRARKSGTQTSHYRGVSLLKQTGKWHAQINVGGKQVHLGFFPTEEEAARAYDRAAINKGLQDHGKIITNFSIDDYGTELDMLGRLQQKDLVEALSNDLRRHQAMKLLSEGFQGKAEEMFQDRGFSFAQAELNDTTTLAALRSKAERAQPKPTEKNPLYAKFLKKEQPPMTPDQLADIEARREAAQRHQEELAEARRSRRQPTRMSGYGSRTSSPSRDGVSPVRTPAASPAKPNRGRLAREGSVDQDMALEMLPASPYMRQQRSRRRRPDADSMPHYLSYTHNEDSMTESVVPSDLDDDAHSHSGRHGLQKEHSGDLEAHFLQAAKPRTKRQEAMMAKQQQLRARDLDYPEPPRRHRAGRLAMHTPELSAPSPIPTPAQKARRPSFPSPRAAARPSLADTLMAAAGRLSPFQDEADLRAAPEDLSSASDSGSQTPGLQNGGHRSKRHVDEDPETALKRMGKSRRTIQKPMRAL
ncbi:hypothetical protein CVIRNUC_008613 [Coccomyxa viridis]|uniref:AP2/ERF domain-containing protein n=1 Tax=Coccomyxa viridis TaxID=1274662 RepID=A0AAV1IHD3_9CHLO|nr:hypothetical protein CVIRNUC_008613 [Coccomyxa viridis]